MALAIAGFYPIAHALAAERDPPKFKFHPLITPPYVCLRTFFVDDSGGQDGPDRGSRTKSWRSLQWANDVGILRGGDCVCVAPGIYAPGPSGTLWLNHGGAMNSPTGYVTFVSVVPQGAKILAKMGSYNVVAVQSPYIVIDGFEIDGNQEHAAGSGIDDEGGAGHHIMVLNNLIHGLGGSGIQINDTDYVTVKNNVTYGNASTNQYQMSGISIYQPQAVTNFTETAADNTTFHIIVANNVSYDNVEAYSCGNNPGCHTDGNGIIIDTTLNTSRKGGAPYPHWILVQGNVLFENGGKGIQVSLSSNVRVVNNTSYNNNLDLENNGTWRGELNNALSYDVQWINNITWSFPVQNDIRRHNCAVNQGTIPGYSDSAVVCLGNITYNGHNDDPSARFPTSEQLRLFKTQNKIGIDPKLTDPSGADFRPVTGSPAIAGAVPPPNEPSASPEVGETRSEDVGAY